MDETRALLRHLLATIAYRTSVCLREAPPGFADHAAGAGVRTPLYIVRHMTQLMGFTQHILVGAPRAEVAALPWDAQIDGLQTAMRGLDGAIAAATAWTGDPRTALQGPLADALTHVGQLATLRRLAGSPIHGGNYPRAEIRAGSLELR